MKKIMILQSLAVAIIFSSVVAIATDNGNKDKVAKMSTRKSSLTQNISKKGLFDLHTDNCSYANGWSFINIIDGKGFCIENNERNALTFEQARRECLNIEANNPARLPEPVEWKLACRQEYTNKTNGKNVTYIDNYEWATNIPLFVSVSALTLSLPDNADDDIPDGEILINMAYYRPFGAEPQGIAAVIMGKGECSQSSWGWLHNNNTGGNNTQGEAIGLGAAFQNEGKTYFYPGSSDPPEQGKSVVEGKFPFRCLR